MTWLRNELWYDFNVWTIGTRFSTLSTFSVFCLNTDHLLQTQTMMADWQLGWVFEVFVLLKLRKYWGISVSMYVLTSLDWKWKCKWGYFYVELKTIEKCWETQIAIPRPEWGINKTLPFLWRLGKLRRSSSEPLTLQGTPNWKLGQARSWKLKCGAKFKSSHD